MDLIDKHTYVMTKNHIIKVIQEDETHIAGFDIISEEFVRKPKNCTMVLLPAVLELIKNERAQLVLVSSFNKTIKEMGEAMGGLSDRTIFRKLSDYGLNKEKNS